MEKNMEDEMETGIISGLFVPSYIIFYYYWGYIVTLLLLVNYWGYTGGGCSGHQESSSGSACSPRFLGGILGTPASNLRGTWK